MARRDRAFAYQRTARADGAGTRVSRISRAPRWTAYAQGQRRQRHLALANDAGDGERWTLCEPSTDRGERESIRRCAETPRSRRPNSIPWRAALSENGLGFVKGFLPCDPDEHGLQVIER